MSRRDRQQVYLVQDIARELENNQPGTIHEIKLVFSGRRLHASIVFDRHRGVEARDGAAQRSSRTDCAPATTGSHGSVGSNAGQQPRQLPTNRVREYKGPTRPVQSARLGAAQPEPKPHRAGIPAGRDRPAAVADVTRQDVDTIERTIKAAITPIVRELGGDEQNGAQYLSRRRSSSTWADSRRGRSGRRWAPAPTHSIQRMEPAGAPTKLAGES